MAEVAEGRPEDARRAVDIAVEAFEEGAWPRISARERGRLLTKASFLIRERQEDLAQARGPQRRQAHRRRARRDRHRRERLRVLGRRGEQDHRRDDPDRAAGIDVTLREPVGVCALITPWNFPAVIATWKIAPALACGNTAIVKPASQTPLTALAIADILSRPGCPREPSACSRAPARRRDGARHGSPGREGLVHGVDRGGTNVMQPRPSNITRVSLELGGKSANVVFDDADLDVAIVQSLWSVFDNTGQDAARGPAQFVQRPIYDEYVERFAEARPRRSRRGAPRRGDARWAR